MPKHKWSREIAKFLAGLITGDLLVLLWLNSEGLLPVRALGRMWTSEAVMPGIAFDLALILILIYYGWNVGRIPLMRERTYLWITGAIFSLSAAAHLLYLLVGQSNFVIAGWTVPLWPSGIMLVLSVYLAYVSFSLRRKR